MSGGCCYSYFHGDNEYDRAVPVRHPVELPEVYHCKQYAAGETSSAPWRIPCFFADRDHRELTPGK